MSNAVLDTAGGEVGGAARWRSELDAYLAAAESRPVVIGRSQRLTPSWLVRREAKARGAGLVVAANSASFAFGGAQRRVLVRNALHFLYPDEQHLLRGLPRSFKAQIPVIRGLLSRADLIVAPTSAMADRVRHHVPAARGRIAVRAHPASPSGPSVTADRPFVLVPIVPASYKDLGPQLSALLEAIARTGRDLRVAVTAMPGQLPRAIAAHPSVDALGMVPTSSAGLLWRSAAAGFFPLTVEAFGYPLAEARIHGVPVLSPDTGQAREVAGPALVPFQRGDGDSLAAALERCAEPVAPEPDAFDPRDYFRWLLETRDPAEGGER
ncbi:glycosyltransferase [Glycomyces sp. NRRL B-16210]|uniref:glycosyltransferase n=1 Tax=Glycomyces sp. NRRL B-16210 TaxID=1463821 RepID=UPI00068F7389|nr:glycosyltransferase [Glycomyces sp. NRRL B-16210]